MKRTILVLVALLTLCSCASVLRKDLMETGIRDFSFADLMRDPTSYRGKVFILGGVIVRTSLTERGSVVEALYVPVDSQGYLKTNVRPVQRFLAVYGKDRGILDPAVYAQNRQVTIAGVFTGNEQGKIDQMDYLFPVFQIEQIYLWEPTPSVQYVPYPWPGPYWGPYWGPYRGYPSFYGGFGYGW